MRDVAEASTAGRGAAGTSAASSARAVAQGRLQARNIASAAGLVVLTVFCFSLIDAMSKDLAQRYSVGFVVWARYVVQLAGLSAWLLPTLGMRVLRTRHLRLHFVRGMLLAGSSMFAVLAFRYLPLADATALNYSSPTLVAVMAVLVLKERMTRMRIAFVIAGIVGMLMIVRPGTDVFHGAAVFSVCGAACYALYQVLTSKLAGESGLTLLFYGVAVGLATCTLMLPWFTVSTSIPLRDIAALLASGVLATLGHFLLIRAYQRAPASAIAPFTYMQLVFATAMGWLAFGQLPDAWTQAGMVVIAGSGIVVLWLERRW